MENLFEYLHIKGKDRQKDKGKNREKKQRKVEASVKIRKISNYFSNSYAYIVGGTERDKTEEMENLFDHLLIEGEGDKKKKKGNSKGRQKENC